MGNNTAGQAAGLNGKQVVDRASEEGGKEIGPEVREAEHHGDHAEGKPGEGAERHFGKIFFDQVAQEESAPKNFLEQRDNHDKAHKPQDECAPVKRGRSGKDIRIESLHARFRPEEQLGRDPYGEDDESGEDRRDDVPLGPPLVSFPEPEDEAAAQNGLQRVDPVFGFGQPKRGVFRRGKGLHQGNEGQSSHEDSKGKDVGPQGVPVRGGVGIAHATSFVP